MWQKTVATGFGSGATTADKQLERLIPIDEVKQPVQQAPTYMKQSERRYHLEGKT